MNHTLGRRHANDEGMRIKVLNSLRKETVIHFVGMLWPRLQEQSKRALSKQLVDALQDVTDQVW